MKTRVLKCIFRLLTLLFSLKPMVMNAQPKGFLYDEAKVLPFELPDLFRSADGKGVRSVDDWETKRRPEIFRLFENKVYGRSPGQPNAVDFEVVEEADEPHKRTTGLPSSFRKDDDTHDWEHTSLCR